MVGSCHFRSRYGLMLFAWIWVCLPLSILAAADQTPDQGATGNEQRIKELEEEKELIRLFADTLEQVKSRYVETNVSDRELIEAAIQGMISKLDPYSDYIPPEDLGEFRKGVEREYVGIGIQVSEDERGRLLITCPIFGTPAWRAGMRAGDTILKIDDVDTRGLAMDEAIKLMSGDSVAGTEVRVTVLHPDSKDPELVVLKRERIEQPTVIGFHRNAEGVWDYFCDADARIAYLRITAFSGNTARDLRKTLRDLLEQEMQGLIVDLRFNPGGLLNQAIEVSDLFLHEGRIVSIEGRGTKQQSWDARDAGTLIPKGFPVAVLVNRYSASAAEIVSACLQDNHAAIIVGERTWGKGSVQNIIVLDNGKSALKLTTAGYHRPSGQNIHRQVGASEDEVWGVSPDPGFVIPFGPSDIRELGTLFLARDELTKVMPVDGETENPELEATPEEPSGEASGETTATADAWVDRHMEKALEALRDQIGSTTPQEPKSQPPTEEAGKTPRPVPSAAPVG